MRSRNALAGVGVVLYVGALSAAIFTPVGASDLVALPLTATASVLLGLLVGQGWAVALALIMYPLGLAQGPCDPSIHQCEVPLWYRVLTVMVPSMLLIAFGVVARWIGETWWARRSEANAKRRPGIR